jgi:hypothetical protein
MHRRNVGGVAGRTRSVSDQLARTDERNAKDSPLTEVLADCGLAETVGCEEELGDVGRLHAPHKAMLKEEYDAL